MSNSFLTVEDVNTAKFNRKIGFYRLNISDLSESQETIKYDFMGITYSNNLLTVKITNAEWTGGYVVLDSNGRRINITPSYVDDEITFDFSSVEAHAIELELNPFANFSFKEKLFKLTSERYFYLNKLQFDENQEIVVANLSSGETISRNVTLSEGINQVNIPDNSNVEWIIAYLVKTDFQFNLNQRVTVGKVNKVRLNTDEDYLPNGDLTDGTELDITVTIGEETLNCYYDETVNDYCFDLDLTSKTDTNSLKCIVNVNESKYVNPSSMETSLKCNYLQVSNFSDLVNEIIYGSELIELTNDITFLSRINVNHDLVVYAKGHELDFNKFGFNILNNATFKLNEAKVINGNSSIIQALRTKVDVTNCSFTNCISDNYNNLGSVIYCDVNLESLADATDFTTNITGCTFKNNTCCIFHGGDLNITNSKLHNTDTKYVDMNNPALICQTDGSCSITSSVFDITYNSDALCSQQINIGFGQALILCGETALINTYTREQLSHNDNLPFFEAPYNNQSHIFAKYYYPQIEECVITSPVTDKEDKSVCYAVTENDWVYTSNAHVTKASNHEENSYNPIIWED